MILAGLAVVWLALVRWGVRSAIRQGTVGRLDLLGAAIGLRRSSGDPDCFPLVLAGRMGSGLLLLLAARIIWGGPALEIGAAASLIAAGLLGAALHHQRFQPILPGLSVIRILLRLPDEHLLFLGKVEGRPFSGSSLADLDLRRSGLLVLAIGRDGRYTHFPKGQEVIAAGDRLLMYGRIKDPKEAKS